GGSSLPQAPRARIEPAARRAAVRRVADRTGGPWRIGPPWGEPSTPRVARSDAERSEPAAGPAAPTPRTRPNPQSSDPVVPDGAPAVGVPAPGADQAPSGGAGRAAAGGDQGPTPSPGRGGRGGRRRRTALVTRTSTAAVT